MTTLSMSEVVRENAKKFNGTLKIKSASMNQKGQVQLEMLDPDGNTISALFEPVESPVITPAVKKETPVTDKEPSPIVNDNDK